MIDSPGILAATPPALLDGWVYYVACGVAFLLAGFLCGFVIWRKGNMQTQEAETEVRETEDELKLLREDILKEERELRPEDDGEAIDELLSKFGGEKSD